CHFLIMCNHKLLSGKNKGNLCNKKTIPGEIYCSSHKAMYEKKNNPDTGKPTCAFKLISGKNKDSLCSKKPLINGKYCSIHQKKINQVKNVVVRTPTPEKIFTLIKPTEETNQIIPVETPRRPNPGKMEITKAVTFNPLK